MKKIFVLTGETSGDKLASKVVVKLKNNNPNIEFLSVGGEYLKSLALARGINTNSIKLTPAVKNTDEEAEAILRLLGRNNTIALVTSAFHMPRAIKVFEKRHLNVVPIAVDRRVGVSKLTFLDFLPSGNALAENSLFFREVIGRAYYKLIY